MAAVAISARWRWFSAVFGVLVPVALCRTLLAAGVDSGIARLHVSVTVISSLALAGWLCAGSRWRNAAPLLGSVLVMGGLWSWVWALLPLLEFVTGSMDFDDLDEWLPAGSMLLSAWLASGVLLRNAQLVFRDAHWRHREVMSMPSAMALWRWFGLLFGVCVPVLVWAFLCVPLVTGRGSTSANWFFGTQAVFVAIEVVALTRWLRARRRTPGRERALAVWFSLGTLFACYWCFVVLQLMQETGGYLDPTGWALAASPFPCVSIYGVSAVMAFRNARRLARRQLCAA